MQSGADIPVVLFGVGRMGQNHLRVIQENQDFRLVAVVDPRLAAERSHFNDIPVVASADNIEAAYSAAVIASPTETHYALAKDLIQHGKNILIEKPLADTVDRCLELTALAKKNGVAVSVGHVERFNPVVQRMWDVINAGWVGKVIHYSFTRLGGYPESVADGNNVLVDLAVHDLDILQKFAGDISIAAAVCHSTHRAGIYDTSEMLLRTANGASASIHSNWVTPTKIRMVRITGSKGVLFADLILQTCIVHGGDLLVRGPEPVLTYEELRDTYRHGDRIEFGVREEEPLHAQLSAYARRLRGLKDETCTLEEATRSVELAKQALRMGMAHAESA
jgi:UDP-N-acetylglucosamine 3-dehydrogenase